jgi:hypothetical protein
MRRVACGGNLASQRITDLYAATRDEERKRREKVRGMVVAVWHAAVAFDV